MIHPHCCIRDRANRHADVLHSTITPTPASYDQDKFDETPGRLPPCSITVRSSSFFCERPKAIMALRAIIDSWAAHRAVHPAWEEDPCSIDSLSVIQIHADVFFHVCKRRFQGTGSAKRKCIVMVISAGGHDTFLHFVENCRICTAAVLHTLLLLRSI